MRRTTCFALLASALMLVGFGAAPAAAGTGASPGDAAVAASTGSLSPTTFSVADNTSDNTTDDNASDDNTTDDGNATAFGQRVSSFVHALQSNETTNGSDNGSLLAQADDAKNLGVVVATFVTANNPGNAPDHAGPPAWLLDDSVNKTTGPPDHAGPEANDSGGPPENKSTGPPDDKGNDKNSGGPPDDKGNDKNNGGGPPDHANNGDDEDDGDE